MYGLKTEVIITHPSSNDCAVFGLGAALSRSSLQWPLPEKLPPSSPNRLPAPQGATPTPSFTLNLPLQVGI